MPENSLAVQVPSLEAEWDAEKNAPLKFADLTIAATKRSGGGVLRGTPTIRSSRAACRARGRPVCAGRVVLPDENSLAARYPALAAEWDTEKNASLLPTQGRRGNAEKSLVEMPQRAQLFRLCRVPCARLRLSGLWRKDGRPRRKRPRHPIPAACRPMGRCEKRRSDAGDGASWLQPPRVVALRRWTFLPRRHLPPRAERKRLSVLRQPQGPARLQRPRGHRAGRCPRSGTQHVTAASRRNR